MDYSFQRYLAAKKTVDDRALNLGVWNAFRAELAEIQASKPVRILETGAGIGTMIQRLLDAGLVWNGTYTAVDELAENIDAARQRLAWWAGQNGWEVRLQVDGMELARGSAAVKIELNVADVTEFAQRRKGERSWDVLVASAFLDLFDVPRLLQTLKPLAGPSGLAYFPINFDGVTIFEPVIEPALDSKILELYHRSMDERVLSGERSGDSQAGRHLFRHLAEQGFDLLSAGSSDWVVFANDGSYGGDEAYFLHHIIHFFEESLGNHPELAPDALERWTAARHTQIERGELVYIAHQMDFLARVSE